MLQLTEIAVSYVPTDVSRIKSPQLSARVAHLVAGRTKRQAQWMNASRAESGTPRANMPTQELTIMEQHFPNLVALHALQVDMQPALDKLSAKHAGADAILLPRQHRNRALNARVVNIHIG